MSDLIKVHNDIMSVQQKLIECDKAISAPFYNIDTSLDSKINNILETITVKGNENTNSSVLKHIYTPVTPFQRLSTSKNDSFDSKNTSVRDDTNESANSSKLSNVSVDSLVNTIRDFKYQAGEIEKMLDDNSALLK